MRRPAPVDIAASSLALGMAGVGQLAWIRSGSARRNSYEMLRSAQRLGLHELTPLRVVWYLLPVASLVVILLVVLGRRRVAALVVTFEAVVVGLAGSIAWTSGLAAGLGAPVATALGGAGLLVGGLLFAHPIPHGHRRRQAE
jgi:hypothetical protein